MAWLGMAFGYGMFLLGRPDPYLAIVAAIIVAAGAVYVTTRPLPKSETGPVDSGG